MRADRRRGATTVEMTLVGIPLIFILICVFEISRGMWVYHTLAYAAKNGVRMAIVHGVNCVKTADNPNDCAVTVAQIAGQIQSQSAIGPDPSETMVTFTDQGGNQIQCYLGTPGKNPPYTATPGGACSAQGSTWPPATYNAVGNRVRIDIETPFNSALSMLWPGAGKVSFGLVNFGATAADYIAF